MLKFDKTEDYVTMWDDDKKSILSMMHSNMQADLNAGYDVCGKSIREQMEDITEYRNQYFDQVEKLIAMEEPEANRWAFMDMLRRGVIE